MGNKKAAVFTFNWQSTTPIPFVQNKALTGVTAGAMSGTNTIYTNIQDLFNYDYGSLEVSWTGTPTGVISYLGSNSGTFFFPVTVSTAQPSGSAGGFGLNLSSWPYRFLLVEYTNTSGSGNLSIVLFQKDVN